jgi:VWFA-related protein
MTTQQTRATASVALILGLTMAIGAAQQPPPQRAKDILTEGVRAVLVDVVVRDKRGQPVRDLALSDFEVLEDGVPQAIGSFKPVFAGGAPTAPATPPPEATGSPNPAAGSPPPSDTGPAVTALVFDRLSPEARRLAVKAAQSYLGNKAEAPNYIGIFGIDLAMTPYAPFTRSAHV